MYCCLCVQQNPHAANTHHNFIMLEEKPQLSTIFLTCSIKSTGTPVLSAKLMASISPSKAALRRPISCSGREQLDTTNDYRNTLT